MYDLVSLAKAALGVAKRITATNTGAAVDVSDFTGNCAFILNSSATEAADNTATVKLTHCDTEGGVYTDTGIAFAAVTNAAASHQELLRSVDGLKKYVKVVNTLAGTSPAVTFSVEIIGKKANG